MLTRSTCTASTAPVSCAPLRQVPSAARTLGSSSRDDLAPTKRRRGRPPRCAAAPVLTESALQAFADSVGSAKPRSRAKADADEDEEEDDDDDGNSLMSTTTEEADAKLRYDKSRSLYGNGVRSLWGHTLSA